MAERLLVLNRIAAWAMNATTDQLGMGTFAHRFNGDDPDAWVETAEGVKALIRGRPVAEFMFDQQYRGELLPSVLNIRVSSIFHIVRTKYLSEFNPFDYGVEPQYGINWMGDKDPDLVATVTLEAPDEQVPGLFSPRNFLPQTPVGRHFTVTGSMDRDRS